MSFVNRSSPWVHVVVLEENGKVGFGVARQPLRDGVVDTGCSINAVQRREEAFAVCFVGGLCSSHTALGDGVLLLKRRAYVKGVRKCMFKKQSMKTRRAKREKIELSTEYSKVQR